MLWLKYWRCPHFKWSAKASYTANTTLQTAKLSFEIIGFWTFWLSFYSVTIWFCLPYRVTPQSVMSIAVTFLLYMAVLLRDLPKAEGFGRSQDLMVLRSFGWQSFWPNFWSKVWIRWKRKTLFLSFYRKTSLKFIKALANI